MALGPGQQTLAARAVILHPRGVSTSGERGVDGVRSVRPRPLVCDSWAAVALPAHDHDNPDERDDSATHTTVLPLAALSRVPLTVARNVIHLRRDYDCFYASVFEVENPALKSLPLAVQQKQIVVTCNYEARRRGLRKLQLIKEAKKVCPDVVIVLGEDLTRFRDASKELHSFLRKCVWNDFAEKLGFDEVFLDVTAMVDYNIQFLNFNNLQSSFFQLDKNDPTVGFAFDASMFCGPTYPTEKSSILSRQKLAGQLVLSDSLDIRLILGSHLANYLRHQLEEHTRYSATVGVSTSKLLAKLVGNVNKPRSQTTLIPPYLTEDCEQNNILKFLDPHEIGKVPGIGFKMASRIRAHILGRQSKSGIYQELSASDKVTVGDVRLFPGMGPPKLDHILEGGGWPKDIGTRVWYLLNGVEDTAVAQGRNIPSQISIEDSYAQLDSIQAVQKAVTLLAHSLLRRMHADLTEEDGSEDDRMRLETTETATKKKKKWLAQPRTLRLSTRARPGASLNGSQSFQGNRISKSCPMPQFIFSFTENAQTLSQRLVEDTIIPLFRRLHPDKSGYKLSLINIAVTNMLECAGTDKGSIGQDIGKLFRSRENEATPRSWPGSANEDRAPKPDGLGIDNLGRPGLPLDDHNHRRPHHVSTPIMDAANLNQHGESEWASDEDIGSNDSATPCDECPKCGALVPCFAAHAHAIYHSVQQKE
ncbi:hypothetical protein LOZ51_003140 [Ophidiomyces ophidiicola]|nr:hypothetical protein LOZ51_003140 [Ophidiomyces ophidiicola]